jgi:DNA-binding MarR family transcriptional regulator
MNAIFFGLKRAFHSTLGISRAGLAACGLTAARFDLLYCLYQRDSEGASQRTLTRKLGVTRSTVSRMLASLEALGVVARKRHVADRRQRWVTLTNAGRARIRKAVRRLDVLGSSQLAVDSALGGERWYDFDSHGLLEMAKLDDMLSRIRSAFADFATLYYPWHPDD